MAAKQRRRILSLLVTLIIIITQLALLGRANGFNLTTTTTNQNQYLKATRDTLLELRGLLLSKSIKFDESFRQLLSSSKRDFHIMFAQTYGLHYERNSEIFTDMYEDLERYYATGGIKLDKSMEHFFHRLYQKMFQVLNAQYEFNESYLDCISQQLERLKPFGDIAENFIAGIKKSFIATRTFLQSLNNGIDIIKNVIELGQSSQCQTQIQTKLQATPPPPPPPLQGQGGIGVAVPVSKPPCFGLCEQVMTKSCFRYNQDLDREWNIYVDSLIKLANKLRTSINIESVVDPIDLRISEAIMNFQDNGVKISQQVFQACGMPQTSHYLNSGGSSPLNGGLMGQPLTPITGTGASGLVSRYRRDYSNGMQLRTRTNNRNRASVSPSSSTNLTPSSVPRALTFTPFVAQPTGNHHNTPNTNIMMAKNSQQSLMLSQATSPVPNTSTTSTTTSASDEQKIENLIVEIRQQMNRTIGFWSRLPAIVCLNKQTLGNTSKQISAQSNCHWSPLSEQDNNQSVGLSLSRHFKTAANVGQIQANAMTANEAKHSSTIQQQVNTLKMTINKITKAFDGLDVDWGESNLSSVSPLPSSTSTPTTTATTTTTTPEPSWSSANGSGTNTNDEGETDDNSLPWCPNGFSAEQEGDFSVSESNDDQPINGDYNRNNNQQPNDEFGSGDGATSDSDDESSSDGDDGGEEDEEESGSESTSSGHNDNENYNSNDDDPSVDGESTSRSEPQQSSSITRGWYRGRPCRIQPGSSKQSTVDNVIVQTTTLPNVNIDTIPDGILSKDNGGILKNITNSSKNDGTNTSENDNNNNNGIDISRQTNNNLDDSYPLNKMRLEIGPFPNDPQSPPPIGSSAAPHTTATLALPLWIPLIVTVSLTKNIRLTI